MITLKTEHGFVRVEKWEGVTALPGFVAKLNRSQHKLKDIIGRYIFPHTINCGLSDCRSQHKKGYVVSTESGELTNIGWMCGIEYFGADFKMQSGQFERDVEDQTNRETLATFSFHIDRLQEAVDALRNEDRGANWVYKKTRPLLGSHHGCPDLIVQRFQVMVKAGQNQLTQDRQATKEETDVAEAAAGRAIPQPHMISEVIAHINGMAALNPQSDLRQLLVIDIHDELKKFRELDIDSLGHNDLLRWAKWVSSIDGTMERAGAAIAAGRELLTVENLTPLSRLLWRGADKTEFRQYLTWLSEK